MKFSQQIETFINDFVQNLNEGSASIFAGAGLSQPAGFVNWSKLMEEIAKDLGLDVNMESDLVSIAQYHQNENQNRDKLNRKIVQEFVEDTKETENHRIISRLPISSIWTTNYDTLIETAFKNVKKIADVKYTNQQLLHTKPKRDVVIFKMHGDVNHPSEAILTKEQYERYHISHQSFIDALSGELITKTFLFLGFSFSDPNLDYVLSRLHYRFKENKRQHFCFVKKHRLDDSENPDKATFDYNTTKQNLIVNDLKRYGIKSLWIDDYNDITEILKEIENRYKKRTIFISGSAEVFEPFTRNESLNFIHILSKKIVENNFRIVNGFGWNVGSSVINGALDCIYSNPTKYSEDQLVLKPFPQIASGGKDLKTLWEDYRQNIISQAGISIFLFGNKKDEHNNIVEANGVIREFEISHQKGNICIPVPITGFAAKAIYDKILLDPKNFFTNPDEIIPILKELANDNSTLNDKVSLILKLINKIK